MSTSVRDYRASLNPPKTEFPMRAGLAKSEPARVAWWKENGTCERRLAKNKSNEPWILNDGPPHANGDLHMGHFLNRVLKDAFIKIHLLDGRWADFIPGWDMHGLPIERETLKHFGIDFHKIDPIELRAACRERALHWLDRQRSTILRESTVIGGSAAGEKYARCWKYLPIGTDPDHPAACASCATIVREIDKNKS